MRDKEREKTEKAMERFITHKTNKEKNAGTIGELEIFKKDTCEIKIFT